MRQLLNLQVRPLPLRLPEVGPEVTMVLVLEPLVLRRPRESHEISPLEALVLVVVELLHVLHVLDLQPIIGNGKT